MNFLQKKENTSKNDHVRVNAEEFTREYEQYYRSLFEDCIGGAEERGQAMSFYDVLDAVAEFKENINVHLANPNQPLGNVINANYAQGILIEEGCVADIYSNHISANLKANIALGGQGSGETKIKKNLIENGKKEGIFVVEGGENLNIQTNII